MTFPHKATLALVAAATLVGCSGGDAEQTSTPPDSATSAPSTGETAPASASPSEPAEQQAPPATSSYATVTVDGETWEFSPFRCAVGMEQTGSDAFTFSTDARGAGDGDVQLQFQINARDDSGQNRLEGDGVIYDFTLYDFGSASPTIDYSGDATEGVTIGAGTLVVDTTFTSISGESYAVTVDAVCAS